MSDQEIVNAMQELKASRGWGAILGHIQPIIDSLELRLLGDVEMSLDDQKEFKTQWKLYKKFVGYPDLLISKTGITPPPSSAGEDLDPYAK